MANISKYPKHIERAICLNISKFKPYFNHSNSSGTIRWILNNGVVNEALIGFNMTNTRGVLEINYNWQSIPITYTIELISKQSNLGNSKLWYFVCPETKKLCRKLHFKDGLFLHRTAFENFCYIQQSKSKLYRDLYSKPYNDVFNECLYHDMAKMHLKRYYRGKPTKTYLTLLKREDKAIAKINDHSIFTKEMHFI